MASPPYAHSPTALSPTSSQPYGNSKKRPSEAGGVTPSLKRRKQSIMSVNSTIHPLRQTSFPPDESQNSFYSPGARSPSVDSMSLAGGSQVSGTGLPLKKKRGRKSKAEKAAMAERERDKTPSLVGGARSVISDARGGRGSRVPGQDAAADEEDENMELDRADVQVAAQVQESTAEQNAEENRFRQMLIKAMPDKQFDRFEKWRASGFNKNTVRKLVNSTVSQSVPDNVVLTVRTAAKVFVGELIEAARRVQGEWVDKMDEKQVEGGMPTPEATPPGKVEESQDDQAGAAGGVDASEEDEQERLAKADRRGPLRPDHLREALRRYKLAHEGGGTGLHDPWHQQQQSGVERFATRTGGRRLFK